MSGVWLRETHMCQIPTPGQIRAKGAGPDSVWQCTEVMEYIPEEPRCGQVWQLKLNANGDLIWVRTEELKESEVEARDRNAKVDGESIEPTGDSR